MLSPQSRPYIDASVPVLREHGEAITRVFYQNMLDAHPELKNIFNMANQGNGLQAKSLASAVFAYAANIDNAAALGPVIERIVHKHASLGVRADHYPIVGNYLLGAIKQVLGDAAVPALIDAWAEAYGLLADTLIAEEKRLYAGAAIEPGQLFDVEVVAVEDEGNQMRAYTLKPLASADRSAPGGDAPQFKQFQPGQYVSVAVRLPDGLRQLRQYSLSDAPGKDAIRITVKRELAGEATPAGVLSNWLHDTVKVGSVLQLSPPFGDFTPDVDGDELVVLLSAGAGVTPMISVLNAIAQKQPGRPVVFAHATHSVESHAHRADLATAARIMPALQVVTFYEAQVPPADDLTVGKVLSGRLRINALPAWPKDVAEVHLCGSIGFLRATWAALQDAGVPSAKLHREVFGPELLDHLL
jgi:nitric oxide dioxygenase